MGSTGLKRYSIDPATRVFLESELAKGGPELYSMSVEQARESFSGYGDKSIPQIPALVEDYTISVPSNKRLKIRIVKPENSKNPLPVLMYFHGGGWMLGDADTYDRLVREISVRVNVAVVFVEYSRTPEAKYPVAIEEAYNATLYVAEHGKEFNIDSSHLAVAGDSSGGNMAIITTMLAKERGGPKISYQVLYYPVTDADFTRPSYTEFTNGYFLSREEVEYFWNHYVPDKQQRYSPKISPLRSSVRDLEGLPPALVITAELDVLRDEGEDYGHKLMEANVPTTSVRINGTVHGFISVDQLRNASPSIAAANLTKDTLQRHLH